jgi:hypothetical protein
VQPDQVGNIDSEFGGVRTQAVLHPEVDAIDPEYAGRLFRPPGADSTFRILRGFAFREVNQEDSMTSVGEFGDCFSHLCFGIVCVR